MRVLDFLSCETRYHVPRLDARLCRRAALGHVAHERAFGFFQVERCREVIGHVLDVDPEISPRHRALAHELGKERLCRVDGYGEAYALAVRD